MCFPTQSPNQKQQLNFSLCLCSEVIILVKLATKTNVSLQTNLSWRAPLVAFYNFCHQDFYQPLYHLDQIKLNMMDGTLGIFEDNLMFVENSLNSVF